MKPSNSQNDGEVQYQRHQEIAECAVCTDAVDGCHFGADACRACAAFFRRTVGLGKEYKCKQEGDCTVTSNVRPICKSCRLKKCLEVGMLASGVQSKRDAFANEEGCSSSTFPTSSTFPPFEATPILNRMKTCYEKLENSRNVIHRKEGESIFEKKKPAMVNFQTNLIQASKEISLVADWIEMCFEEFQTLAVDQKSLLFSNFVPTFIVLERAYLTIKFGKEKQMILPSLDYLEYDRLEEYFTDAENGICGKKLAKLFQPSIELNEKLHELMRSEKVDLYDFFALTVMIFWDIGLVGQSEKCTAVSRKMKHAVAKEYLNYQKYYKGEEDPALHMAATVSILTSLQRVSHRFREDMSFARVFDVYEIPTNLWDVIVGRYS